MGRWSFMTPPAGNVQRRTVRTASESSSGQLEDDLAKAEMTRPEASTVNSTTTVPVWPLRLACAG
mgnify:CR=1 FL=1